MVAAASRTTSAIGIHQGWLSQYTHADAGTTVVMILRVLGTEQPCLEGRHLSSIVDYLDN